jgi:hypothetical protein
MKVREFLQIELWSKETTRKITARTRKFLVRIAIAVLVVALALALVLTLEIRWLTPGVRRDAKDALAKIDTLQDFGSISEMDFYSKLEQAKMKIQQASESAWTIRDSGTLDMLSNYVDFTKQSYKEMKLLEQVRKRMSATEVLKHPSLTSNPAQTGADIRNSWRNLLHKELD